MYTILGPDGPVTLMLNGDQYVVGVAGQNVTAGGSPSFVAVEPPIGPIGTISLGDLYAQLIALLA